MCILRGEASSLFVDVYVCLRQVDELVEYHFRNEWIPAFLQSKKGGLWTIWIYTSYSSAYNEEMPIGISRYQSQLNPKQLPFLVSRIIQICSEFSRFRPKLSVE